MKRFREYSQGQIFLLPLHWMILCLVHNVKKIVKKVLEGAVHLPEKYSKLIEEAISEYKKKGLTLVGAEV